MTERKSPARDQLEPGDILVAHPPLTCWTINAGDLVKVVDTRRWTATKVLVEAVAEDGDQWDVKGRLVPDWGSCKGVLVASLNPPAHLVRRATVLELSSLRYPACAVPERVA